jgi:hypothetical protein
LGDGFVLSPRERQAGRVASFAWLESNGMWQTSLGIELGLRHATVQEFIVGNGFFAICHAIAPQK